MSEPVTENEPGTENEPVEEQVPVKEIKQEPSAATEGEVQQTNGDDSTAMEVDSSQKESNPESADGEEEKPFRRNGASRKRFKWLLDQGYSRNAAAEISKSPFKPKDMREKYIADTGFFKEKINELNEQLWDDLSDAAKRRVKWLMKNGYSEKDALRLANEAVDPSKRNAGSSKRSAEGSELLVMAVASTDYPKTFLTSAQTDEIKAAILTEVVQQKDSDLKPHFKSSDHVNGYLRVLCKDLETRRWLQTTVDKLTPPEGITLQVVAEKEVLKGDAYTAHFKDSFTDTNETIFGFIESQNDGIDISQWIVLNRKEIPESQKIELLFAVDQESARTIRNLDFELNYKFNTVKLRRKKMFESTTNKGPKPKQSKSSKQPSRQPPRQPSNSYVPIFDSNLPKNRGGNNYNQFRGRGKPYGRGFNNRTMPNSSNRPFNMVDSLYDQLNLISGVGSNYNQWGGNAGFNSNRGPRNFNGRGNRGFTPRSSFY